MSTHCAAVNRVLHFACAVERKQFVTGNRLFEAALGSPLIPLIKRRLKAGDFLSLNSVADAGKPLATSLLSQISNRPILVVTDGLKSQEALFNDLQTLLPGTQFYPAWE